MIILNSGIPRSGTVWAFNVFRAVWQSAGVEFRTEHWNCESDMHERLPRISPAEHVLIHTHDFTPGLDALARRPGVRSFFNYRDPRDVVVSQMQLHDIPFEIAAQMTTFAYKSLTCALAVPGIMFLPYDHIIDHAPALIFQMAAKIDILLNFRMVNQIAESTSSGQHQRTMNRLNRQTPSTGSAEIGSLNTGARDIRYCKASLVTDRHIQSGRTGRWRDELTPDQQQHVCAIFAPIIKSLGFDHDEPLHALQQGKVA
jgi:hypothetical protein